jgi:adenylylsulfate kinase
MRSPYVICHNGFVTRRDREILNGHRSGVIWFTGLSASGKSSISYALEKLLFQRGVRTYVLDGDNIRHALNSDLGFSYEDRSENIRRVIEVCKLFVDAGIVVLSAFITPLRRHRDIIRKHLIEYNYIEVYVKCSIETCIKRDPKGWYKKAKSGEIKEYTGISSLFEEPINPDIIIDTEKLDIEESAFLLFEHIQMTNFLS